MSSHTIISHPSLSNPLSHQMENDFLNIPNVYHKFESGVSPTVVHIYINGVINTINEFANILHILRTLREKDRAIVYISSPGGNLTSGAMIASAITQSVAHVTCVATGFVASAGTLIWSAGDVCKVRPGSLIMMHCSSHFDIGNSLDIRDSANRLVNYVKYILTIGAVKKGHLLPEELNQILTKNGTEIYINYETMTDRLKGSESNDTSEYDPKTKETVQTAEKESPDDIEQELDQLTEPQEEENPEEIKEGEVE